LLMRLSMLLREIIEVISLEKDEPTTPDMGVESYSYFRQTVLF